MLIEGQTSIVLIVAAVLLFFFLGIAILVVMDHKARLSGGFKRDPFSISGMRRDHPVEAFVTGTILLGIIVALVFELAAALVGRYDLFGGKEQPKILIELEKDRSAERLRHFHNLPSTFKPLRGKKNVCFYCHGDFPHSKEPMIRTLMNMHTQFIGCMTCHIDEKKIPENSYVMRWLNYSGIEVKGPPYGTDVDKETGQLILTDDYYSKIVVYAEVDGEEKLLEFTSDNPKTKEFARIHDTLSEQDREAVKKKFHKTVRSKGRFCSRCHTSEKKNYLPLKELGFSKTRRNDLTNLSILGLVEKYKRFYMPDLLSTGRRAVDTKATGNGRSRELKKDPRSWWKKQYDR